MACILKLPSSKSKGIISFTTQEQLYLINEKNQNLRRLKKKYFIGLHHNWHNYKFKVNKFYDFYLAGKRDLIEIEKKYIPQIELDAIDFVPKSFKFQEKKYWDLLIVTRPVKFKNIFEIFNVCKKVVKKRKRILIICPFVDKTQQSKKYSFKSIIKKFNLLFSYSERQLINFIHPKYNNNFPLDINTLSFFYKQSKVFLHMAPDERRPRVCAYAYACGLPVISFKESASIIPSDYQSPPLYYKISNFKQASTQIFKALKYVDSKKYNRNNMKKTINHFNLKSNQKKIITKLEKILEINFNNFDKKNFFLEKLDIRLGRHHEIEKNLKLKFNVLINILVNQNINSKIYKNNCDLERELEKKKYNDLYYKESFIENLVIQYKKIKYYLKQFIYENIISKCKNIFQ